MDHQPGDRSPEAWRAEIARMMGAGEYLRASDAAEQAVAAYPDDPHFRHMAALAVVRTGAVEQAQKRFDAYGLDAVATEEVLSLKARLAKDLALRASGAARRALLDRSIAAYEAAFAVDGGYYPAINVATLLALSGRLEAAAPWAERALRLAEAAVESADGADYYALATAAEAHLLLGRTHAAADAIGAAVAAPTSSHAVRAVTLGQLRLIVEALGQDPALLDPLTPPPVVHFLGHIVAPPGAPGRFPPDQEAAVRAGVQAALRRRPVSRAIGSLAAGADIILAEASLAAGAELDIVLPFRLDEFVEISVAPAGEAWAPRMQACLDRARQVHYVTEDAYLGDDALFAYATEFALGLAALRARWLNTEVYQLAVWDGAPPDPGVVGGTANDLALGRRLGLAQEIVPVRSTRPTAGVAAAPAAAARVGRAPRSLLFGDFKGFSRLDDAQLPIYVSEVLGRCADVLARYEARLVFRNTWGDGLFLVLDDVAAAADCAFDLQAAIEAIDHAALGLPATLALRLGFHYGPVYETVDPVLGRLNCFGYHVSRAARVEPITPEGAVYVTEQTAAAMALACPDRYRCEYVGRAPLAKGYGSFPMYHVRPT